MIDTLAFSKAEIFQSLGKMLFENPRICKIMHGCASSDVWWLARDFGFKINTVFDTQEFVKYMEGKSKSCVSLSVLWAQYCEGLFDATIFTNKTVF